MKVVNPYEGPPFRVVLGRWKRDTRVFAPDGTELTSYLQTISVEVADSGPRLVMVGLPGMVVVEPAPKAEGMVRGADRHTAAMEAHTDALRK